MAYVAVPHYSVGSPTLYPHPIAVAASETRGTVLLSTTVVAAPNFNAIVDPGSIAAQYPVGYAG